MFMKCINIITYELLHVYNKDKLENIHTGKLYTKIKK